MHAIGETCVPQYTLFTSSRTTRVYWFNIAACSLNLELIAPFLARGVTWHKTMIRTENVVNRWRIKSSIWEPTISGVAFVKSFVPNYRIIISGDSFETIERSCSLNLSTVRPPTPCICTTAVSRIPKSICARASNCACSSVSQPTVLWLWMRNPDIPNIIIKLKL